MLGRLRGERADDARHLIAVEVKVDGLAVLGREEVDLRACERGWGRAGVNERGISASRKPSGGDPEAIRRRSGGDQEALRRRSGAIRGRSGGDQEAIRGRSGGDQEAIRRRSGGDQEATRRRSGGYQEAIRRRSGGSQEAVGRWSTSLGSWCLVSSRCRFIMRSSAPCTSTTCLGLSCSMKCDVCAYSECVERKRWHQKESQGIRSTRKGSKGIRSTQKQSPARSPSARRRRCSGSRG